MSATLRDGDTLLFIGDSITDCGRRETAHAPLGCGYVKMLHNLLTVREPETRVHIVNRGIGGNTAEDLFSRWHDDVVVERPDHLAVMIGINDCNRFLCDPSANSKQSPTAYRDYLDRCLRMTREGLPGASILLISPFHLSRDRGTEAYRGRVSALLLEYQAAIREAAIANSAAFLDSQAEFERVLAHRLPSEFSNDMVHLNEAGALLLTEVVHRQFTMV